MVALKTSILTDQHRAAGADLTTGEVPLLLTYGEVPDEYEAARSGCVVFDQTARGLLEVSGSDAGEFLHRLLSNDVRGLEPGHGNRSLLLSGKGKVQFDFDLALESEGLRLSTPRGQAAGLLQALDMYLFADDVTLSDATETHAPLDLYGPRAAALVGEVLGPVPGELHASATAEFEGATVRVTNLLVAGGSGVRVDAGPAAQPALWNALVAAGAVPAGAILHDILRVESCAAQPGVDVDDTVYPQEARLEAAFSLDKGCYIGQEVVAKIDTYGGLNKRLVALKVSHDDPVPRGTRLLSGEGDAERDLGMVTSWAYSFVLDTGLVLAYVKRRHQDPGTEFRLAEDRGQATLVGTPVYRGPKPAGAPE